MFKAFKINLFIISLLTAALALSLFSSHLIAAPEDAFSDIKGKMEGISDKERETLQKLFIQVQEIEELERQEKGATRDVERIKAEIADLKRSIAAEETAYAKMQESLKQVLTSYQKMGPGTYLEIILKSEDLPDLLMRINTLRDLTRSTGDLLRRIRESGEKQSAKKNELAGKLASMEEKKKQLAQDIAKQKQLKENLEKSLASLAEKRGQYQEYLEDIQKTWAELKPFFSKTIKDFSSTIRESDLPPDGLKITFSLLSVKVSIQEKALNDIIKGKPGLPEIALSFKPGKVELKLPEKNLYLSGKFTIFDDHSLKFQMEEGTYYGMLLGTGAINELFEDGALILNLEAQLNGFKLNSLEMLEGSLNFTIKP